LDDEVIAHQLAIHGTKDGHAYDRATCARWVVEKAMQELQVRRLADKEEGIVIIHEPMKDRFVVISKVPRQHNVMHFAYDKGLNQCHNGLRRVAQFFWPYVRKKNEGK